MILKFQVTYRLITHLFPFSSGASSCFDDPPLPTLQRPSEPPLLLSHLPGVIYDANKQCELLYATSAYNQCPGRQASASIYNSIHFASPRSEVRLDKVSSYKISFPPAP